MTLKTPYSFGEKVAIAVEQGGIGSRAIASTLGHVGAFPLMTILSPKSHVNPSQWQGASGSIFDREISPDDARAQKHKQLAEDMAKTNPQELKDTMVYMGAPNLLREYGRLYKNPRSSLPGKLYAGLTLPLTAAMVNISRGSAYHPMTDSVYHMGDKPSVLTHELGHAIDFNSRPTPEHKPGTSKLKTWFKRQGQGLSRDLYAVGRTLPAIGGLLALPQETLANTLSLENLKKTYADQPEKLEKLLAERQKVLPAGMGSYVGNAIAGLGGPMGQLLSAPLTVGGIVGGKAYGLAQHARRKGKYVENERKQDEANAAETDEILQFVQRGKDKKDNDDKDDKDDKDNKDRDQPRRKAASFGDKLRGMVDNYNKSFENTYGVDIRLPHDMRALRQMLIASAVGGGLGLGRGLFWPGYIEQKDDQGRIVAKRKRSPFMGALEGAAIGAGTSALSSYAAQTLAQYNPEIDQFLQGAKHRLAAIVNPTKPPIYGVDFDPGRSPAAGRV